MSTNGFIAKCIARVFCLFPIKPNKVVFTSFHGKYYNDAPKNIADYLPGNIEQIWVLNDPTSVPDGIKTVKPYSIGELFHLETAKVWVDNSRKYLWVKKRKGQYYIQTWHGGAAIKKIEKDAEETLPESYVERAKYDSSMADLFVSDCDFLTNQFRTIFWYQGEIMKSFVRIKTRSKEEILMLKKKVCKAYCIDEETKLVIYAPTFRDSGNLGPYEINCRDVLKALSERFGGTWKIILRLHPNVAQYQDRFTYNDSILNGSLYSDLDELICSSDITITDYSSCIFYAMYLGKLGLIFANDWMEYDRGFSVDIKGLPTPFAASNDELINNIRNLDLDEYERRRSKFVSEIGYYDNISPSVVADRIVDVVNGDYEV